jgi:hypothetical protein
MVPDMLRDKSRMKTQGLPASIQVTDTPSIVSVMLPVGRSLPVLEPLEVLDLEFAFALRRKETYAGLMKASWILAAVPATPSMAKSPSDAASPSITGNDAWIILPVFVL